MNFTTFLVPFMFYRFLRHVKENLNRAIKIKKKDQTVKIGLAYYCTIRRLKNFFNCLVRSTCGIMCVGKNNLKPPLFKKILTSRNCLIIFFLFF